MPTARSDGVVRWRRNSAPGSSRSPIFSRVWAGGMSLLGATCILAAIPIGPGSASFRGYSLQKAAYSALLKGNLAAAEYLYTQALNAAGRESGAYYGRAQARQRLGNLDGAL